MKHFLTILFLLGLLALVSTLSAQWQPNGNLVCGSRNDQTGVQSVSDGAGGAYIVWRDFRNAPADSGDIFAQRIDANGNPVWAANGIAICNASAVQASPRIAAGANSSGTNDLYVVWADGRNSPNAVITDVYAQRISSAGTAVWTANGARVTPFSSALSPSAASPPSPPQLAINSAGEVFVVWYDVTNYNPAALPSGRVDIDAEKLNPVSGARMWPLPVLVSDTVPQVKLQPVLTTIGADAFIAWDDFRNNTSAGTPSDIDIYCQRLTPSGTPVFTRGGIKITNTILYQLYPVVVSSGNNAIVGWLNLTDFTGTTAPTALAQAVSPTGSTLWLPETTISSEARSLLAASDASAGLVATYTTSPDGISLDVSAQRISPNGIPLYGTGALVCTADSSQLPTSIVTDSLKGVYIAWIDNRAGNVTRHNDIYAQRLTLATGARQWGATDLNGAPVTGANYSQRNGQIAVSSTTGDIIVSFINVNADSSLDIKANRVSFAGQSVVAVKLVSDIRSTALSLAQNYPNPFGTVTDITFSIPDDAIVKLTVTDELGREVKTLLNAHLAAGSYSATMNREGLTGGVYTYRLSTANGYSATRQMIVTK